MKFFEMIINTKINKIQPQELMEIARQYQIRINPQQAEQICSVLYGKNINIFDLQERKLVVSQIASIAGAQTASEIESIFNQLTNTK